MKKVDIKFKRFSEFFTLSQLNKIIQNTFDNIKKSVRSYDELQSIL